MPNWLLSLNLLGTLDVTLKKGTAHHHEKILWRSPPVFPLGKTMHYEGALHGNQYY
jgi:hypothetical protein